MYRAILQESSPSPLPSSSSNNVVNAETTQHQVTTQHSRTSLINQTLQSININNNNNNHKNNSNNNNNNNSNKKNKKIHSNVDQQISSRDRNCKEDGDVDEEVLVEPNNNTNNHNNSNTINNNNNSNNSNNTNNHHYSSSRACYRHHPVSRRGTEFISQQVPSFRTFASGGGPNNKYITQRKG